MSDHHHEAHDHHGHDHDHERQHGHTHGLGGHVLSMLAIGVVVWIAGVAFATRFGNIVDTVASIALVAFGGRIALSGLREVRGASHGHGHSHGHSPLNVS
jgi:hypothetical protein